MSFATIVRNRNTERLVALFSAIAVLMSLMAVYARPAQAHHPEITAAQVCGDGPGIEYTAESWLTTGASGSGHSDIRIEARVEDGDWVEVGSGAFTAENDYSFGGTFDRDDLGEDISNTTVTVRATANGPWDNGQGGGESRETSVTIDQDCPDPEPDVQEVSITPTLNCDVSWTGGAFTMRGLVDFVLEPDEGVESISITPKAGGDPSIEGATWTGDPVSLLPWDYTWTANLADGYEGDPVSGEILMHRDFFLECTCPAGTIDLSNSGVLLASQSGKDSLSGQPASPVTIPEGLYEIHLASFDDHSDRPDQGADQTQEQWRLTDLVDNTGGFASPATGDLPDNLNFQSYHVTASTGPVNVPEFSSADIWVTHVLLGGGNPVNSIQPACAQFTPVAQEVDVDVVANSCQVNDQGQPVGSIDISVDPDSQATVRIYDDPAKTADDLVAEVTSTDSIDDLAPGTYFWEAEAAAGFELTGASEGEVTIEDCQSTVTVATNGVCEATANGALGSVEISVDPSSSAEVTVYSDVAMTQEVLSTSEGGEFDLAPGTYYWNAEAADGFDLTGETSGQFTIEPCDTSVTVGGTCVVEDETGVGLIDVTIATPGSATVEITDSNNDVVATLTESGTVTVPEGASYSWTAVAADGFEISGAASGEVEIDECTPPPPPPPPPPEDAEIIVEKVVVGDGSQTFEFTFDTDGFTLDDDTLAHGQSSSSGAVTPGDGYSVAEVVPNGWTQVSAVCDDGSDPSNIDVEAGEQVTCTFTNQIEDEVLAAIQVTVEGSCEVDDDEGEGLIEVTIAVADGATVVVEDSDGDVVGTLTSDGTITVPEGATYTWEATPNEGFEFPAGFESSGSIVIETCSDPDELPFTGMNMDVMAALGAALLGTGIAVVTTLRKREEALDN